MVAEHIEDMITDLEYMLTKVSRMSTRVYLAAAARDLSEGRRAFMLAPLSAPFPDRNRDNILRECFKHATTHLEHAKGTLA